MRIRPWSAPQARSSVALALMALAGSLCASSVNAQAPYVYRINSGVLRV